MLLKKKRIYAPHSWKINKFIMFTWANKDELENQLYSFKVASTRGHGGQEENNIQGWGRGGWYTSIKRDMDTNFPQKEGANSWI